MRLIYAVIVILGLNTQAISEVNKTDLTPYQILKIESYAKKGVADAQYLLASMYMNGQGIRRDLHKAFKWFKKAALQGHMSAQYNIGVMFDNGMSVKENNKEAVKWYKAAASKGFAQAQYNLGIMYFNGESIQENIIHAYKWFIIAANAGNQHARNGLEVLKKNMTRKQINKAEVLAKKRDPILSN